MDKCIMVNLTMKNFNKPWAIAGGWSIDLFFGKVTRQHDDIEIVLYRRGQLAIQEYLDDWAFKKVQNRTVLPWGRNEYLALPIHETYAERNNEKLEILLNETDGEH
ncbi:nucleotidyltransferase domain-containing protein [Paenibacillus xylaniclasticus]